MGRVAHADFPPIMNILGSDGTLRLVVPEGTEGAVFREYETSDGKKGSKWELVFKSLSGVISNMQFHDGDYGRNLMVTLAYDGGEDTISLPTASPFGEDFMKKLPNLDLKEVVEIAPFSFQDEKTGKIRRGVTVKQAGKEWKDDKVPNFFYKAGPEGSRGENINGYPTPEGDTSKYTKDDWKIYFLQARKFLTGYVEEKYIPLFADKVAVTVTVAGTPAELPEYPDEDFQPPKF